MIRPMSVDIIRRAGGKKFPAGKVKNLASAILKLLGKEDSELSIALIGNAEMRTLNARFRNKDYPTDVLSFPAERDLPGTASLLGDVIISVDKARQQATDRHRPLHDEMTTLLIHGVLHLLGYDHERSARDARVMSRLEKKIYRALCDEERLQV
jgi:rRNA maturation RNase YbeY